MSWAIILQAGLILNKICIYIEWAFGDFVEQMVVRS